MKPFCEIITSTVLPAIRSIMTKELLTTYDLTQKQTADLLGLTQPAISQYNREARGSKVKILQKEPEVMKMIDELTKNIVDKRMDGKEINQAFCNICKKIRKTRIICGLHEDIYPSIAPCSECL